jgi:hypothetical protein
LGGHVSFLFQQTKKIRFIYFLTTMNTTTITNRIIHTRTIRE